MMQEPKSGQLTGKLQYAPLHYHDATFDVSLLQTPAPSHNNATDVFTFIIVA